MTTSSNRPPAIEAICREATDCRVCFEHGAITAPTIKIAQPRWIGDEYWTSCPRVCVVMLNPGAGSDHNTAANQQMQALLQSFRLRQAGLDDLFRFQRRDFPAWGKPPGRFLKFFRAFGLSIDRIALVNVAWCATAGNKYPKWMLSTCMLRFTGRLIGYLKPNVVMLSGSEVHDYAAQVEVILPTVRIFKTLHFAHRKGQAEEYHEATRFRAFMASL